MAQAQERASEAGLTLEYRDTFLTLSDSHMSYRPDLARESSRRLRPQNLARELLVRAAHVRGVEHPVAVDATAGMGEDALLLAAAGFSVTMFEWDPVMAALLRDALAHAADSAERPELAAAVGRMTLVQGDSVAGLRDLAARGEVPDVVLLDPMFPERRKSAAVKKKAQLLQRLERPSSDEESAALLEAARAAHPKKVVIKRPVKGPYLAGVKPAYSLMGKAVRFDVIVG